MAHACESLKYAKQVRAELLAEESISIEHVLKLEAVRLQIARLEKEQIEELKCAETVQCADGHAK